MKPAGPTFKKNKKKQEERQTRPAGLDFVFDIGGRQVANQDLTAEDVGQMTQAQIEQIYANGIASVQRLQQDYDTLETFRNMGSLKPENSPYGLSFNKEEWLRQGSYGQLYVFLRKLHLVSHRGCTNLHSHHSARMFPFLHTLSSICYL